MSALQSLEPLSRESSAMDDLQAFLRQHRQGPEPAGDFETFEQTLHRFFVAAEREALAQELARFDLDAPQVEIDGQRHDRVLRCETTYTTAAGPVRVERSLYRSPRGLCSNGTKNWEVFPRSVSVPLNVSSCRIMETLYLRGLGGVFKACKHGVHSLPEA